MVRSEESGNDDSWEDNDDLWGEIDVWHGKNLDDEEGGASSGIPRVPISPRPSDSAMATPD
jgi:hypothetical protein